MCFIKGNIFFFDGKKYLFDQEEVMRLKIDFRTMEGVNIFLESKDKLEETFRYVVDFAIKYKLPRSIAGKFCALLLEVPSINIAIPNDKKASKLIKNRWEVATRFSVPTLLELKRNPQKSYEKICDELAQKGRLASIGKNMSYDFERWIELKIQLKNIQEEIDEIEKSIIKSVI